MYLNCKINFEKKLLELRYKFGLKGIKSYKKKLQKAKE